MPRDGPRGWEEECGAAREDGNWEEGREEWRPQEGGKKEGERQESGKHERYSPERSQRMGRRAAPRGWPMGRRAANLLQQLLYRVVHAGYNGDSLLDTL